MKKDNEKLLETARDFMSESTYNKLLQEIKNEKMEDLKNEKKR